MTQSKKIISRRKALKYIGVSAASIALGLQNSKLHAQENTSITNFDTDEKTKKMKVILINGSMRPKGCTFTALSEVAMALEKHNIETEIFQVGNKPIAGCMGCRKCAETGKCVFDDVVNVFVEKTKSADGFVFGSPVHFAGISGALKSFMDRVFYNRHSDVAYKPAAGIVSARRAGTTAAFDQINKYFTIRQMPVVASQYWNQVHGNTPDEVRQDLEGLQIMRTLGNNMAWLLKSIDEAKKAGISLPQNETTIHTNFIR